MPSFSPVTVDALFSLVLDRALVLPGYAIVAVDGADPADPLGFAETVADRIRTRGRACATVSLHDYVRPASLRLEFGRDEMSYRTAWFDYAGLNREVLQALRERGQWLPALWNESTDRSARATTVSAKPETIVLVAGPMLLGRGLGFDLSVELRLSEGALRRAEVEPFVVAALLRHRRDADQDPDILVAWDHRDRPALRLGDSPRR
ncbi:nucleoside/nucleotide kinase family protein [Nocardia macrotermitis]|uniref:Uridine kinase n=1 Tax=Nocardia macrotermitis TaxID=2585198 RepID=A0A7K0D7X7_9NOCA|nr:hypothetical protein [Nocardia macrotermitis]MQY21866.1 hypothetical protein [Nocardia macrotermitis]